VPNCRRQLNQQCELVETCGEKRSNRSDCTVSLGRCIWGRISTRLCCLPWRLTRVRARAAPGVQISKSELARRGGLTEKHIGTIAWPEGKFGICADYWLNLEIRCQEVRARLAESKSLISWCGWDGRAPEITHPTHWFEWPPALTKVRRCCVRCTISIQ